MKKVIAFEDVILGNTLDEVMDTLQSVKEDYDVPVRVRKGEVKLVLQGFLQYYQKKDILYHFYEMMTGHFEDIAITSVEEGIPIDMDFILAQLKFLELVDSPIEVNPIDTRKTIKMIQEKLEKGPKVYERECRN